MLNYLLGLKSIALYFNISISDLLDIIRRGGVPGIRKLKRRPDNNFPGGGRGVWVLPKDLAESYRHTRRNTPPYDPRRATEALLKRFEQYGCQSIPELFELNLITETDWCQELNRQREISNLHMPILMHPTDLRKWLHGENVRPVATKALYPATTSIFTKLPKGKV